MQGQEKIELAKKAEMQLKLQESEAERQNELLKSMMDEDCEDALTGKHVHAWVLVASGSRDVGATDLQYCAYLSQLT